ncbi:amidase [Corynebacterium phocae]|uniref:amidase n=1 Tax=Corynebacterium phocae TaxID=161895 RepID=A0A1L7D5U3_9CORY|nr:amidase [Corynebacterium phocae]APT93437.1 amidase [Corynebacterium phocae]KAA8721131.1 amidase [Corynebacterium phocae]
MDFSLRQLCHDVAGLTPSQHGFTHLDLSRRPTGRGRLDGWILSAKNLQDVAGMPTMRGTHAATSTDPFLAELESQGATIVGKSAAPELGLWVDTPGLDNPLWPGRSPGGSSGGAAVQVARGLLRAAHASDGGGSIRVPAAACGVVGFKPAGTDLGVAGFITRTVADAAYLHQLTPSRPRARIGILTQPLFAETGVAPVMTDAVAQAQAALSARGYDCTPVNAYSTAGETFRAFRHIFTSRLAGLPEASGYVEWVRQQGRAVTPAQLAAAHRHGAQLPNYLHRYWGVDAIISPTLAYDPPPGGVFHALEDHAEAFDAQTCWSPWGSLFNVAQLPAISVPWPVPGRQPVGIQLGAITLSEEELLGLATELHP